MEGGDRIDYLSVSERSNTSWDDANLEQGVRVLKELTTDSVPSFMVSHRLLLFGNERPASDSLEERDFE